MLGRTESIWQLIGLLLIFVVVVVVCYFTTRFIGGYKMKQKGHGNFELIETFALSQNKYLQLVRIGKKLVVISVTKDNISFLTEVNEEDVVITDDVPQPKISFKDILAKINMKDKE